MEVEGLDLARGPRPGELTLHEEFVLLCLHGNKGAIRYGKRRYGLAGALTAELLLQRLIRVDASRRRKPIVAHNSRWVNDPIMNACLRKIRDAKRRARLTTWVLRLGLFEKLGHGVSQRLCWRGILRAEEKTMLLYRGRIYRQINPNPERSLIERLREAIFTDSDNVSSRTSILVSLADACDLLPTIFGRDETSVRELRIKQLANGQAVGERVRQAVNAAQTVVGTAGGVVSAGLGAALSGLFSVF